MFNVYEVTVNDKTKEQVRKAAKYPDCSVHPSWDNNSFPTFQEAKEYTYKWLGQHVRYDNEEIELDTLFFFSGYGDEFNSFSCNMLIVYKL